MPDRLQRYEERTSTPMLVLALVFIAVYAVPIIDTRLPPDLKELFTGFGAVIWLTFAADLVIRVALSDHRWRYLLAHPIDVLVVVLPILRPLRVLRIFTAGQTLISRAGNLSLGRTSRAIGLTAALLLFIAAVAELDAERNAPASNIHGIGDALWWAATTVTTVGYGDRFPVTGTGRIVAAGLMLVGISLLGLITASVAAWFVSLTQTAEAKEEAALQARLERIEEQLADIRSAVLDR